MQQLEEGLVLGQIQRQVHEVTGHIAFAIGAKKVKRNQGWRIDSRWPIFSSEALPP